MKKLAYLTLLLSSMSVHAQSRDAIMGPEQGLWQTLVMILIAMLFFYFILWRPEQKRRQALDQQRDTMKQGDTVIAMGIKGTVLRIDKDTVIVKMYDGAKVEFLKGAVTEVVQGSEEDGRKAEKENK